MSTLASTSRTQVRYIKETTYGTTPTVGNGKNLRVTSENLQYTLSKTSSNEINALRAVTSMIPTQASASGDLGIEWSFAEYDEFLSAGLQNPWTVYGTAGVSGVHELTMTATTITATVATSGADLFTLLKPGQWFTVTGTASANDNKLFRVSKTIAPTSTVITLDAGTPATVGGPYAAGVVRSSRLSNGVTQPSYTIEKEFADVGEFFSYSGMTLNSLSMAIASGAITTGTLNFMGSVPSQGPTTVLPGAAAASQTNPVMSGVSGSTCALWVAGAPLTGTFIEKIDFSYSNALREQRALCNLHSVGIGSGTIACTANLTLYFASGAVFYDEFLANSNLELSFTSYDTLGNGYVITIPAANVSTYSVNAGGKDADLSVTVQLTALLDGANADATLRKVVFIDRIGSAIPA